MVSTSHRVPAVLLALGLGAGCATARKDPGQADGGGGAPDAAPGPVDAPPGPPPDAAPGIDAAPRAFTLTQTTNTTPVTGTSVACGQPSATPPFTGLNSYYRVFPLADYPAITGTFHVTGVNFWVEQATAGGAASQAAQVKIGSYGGAIGGASLDLAQIVPLNAANIQVPNGTLTMVSTPIKADIPAGGKLVVEIFSPDGSGVGNVFYIGATTAGEARPGYIAAPTCSSGSTVPKSLASLGFPTDNILITVDGTY